MTFTNFLASLGLLVLRIGAGGLMAWGHGWGKIQKYNDLKDGFTSPYEFLGSQWALNLAIFAEFGCAILVGIGLLTRLATIPLIVTMATAAFLVHQADPWLMAEGMPAKEPALLYMVPFVALLLTGPGTISFDALLFGRRQAQDVAA